MPVTGPLTDCACFISPCYVCVIDDDDAAPIAGVIYFTTEPAGKEYPKLPIEAVSRAGRHVIDRYEFEAIMATELSNWAGVHHVKKDSRTGAMVVVLRPIPAQQPQMRRLIWDRLKTYIVDHGGEIAPYCAYDPDDQAKAYQDWLVTNR